jgi:hypothetical protein
MNLLERLGCCLIALALIALVVAIYIQFGSRL